MRHAPSLAARSGSWLAGLEESVGGGAVLPLVRADVFAGRGVYRQHRGAQPRDEALAREGRVRRVPMAAVYLDLALLVGLAVDVADHLERRFRQSGQRGAVFSEQPVLGHAFPVMLLGQPEASVQELLVVRFDAGQPWHGNEEVLPDEKYTFLSTLPFSWPEFGLQKPNSKP